MDETPEITGDNRDEHGRFLPGTSGNPNGRPHGISITDAIKAKLKEVPEGQQKSYLELLINKIMHKAIVEGDHSTLKDIWNYVDGLPRESVDLTSGGKPLPLFDYVSARNNNSNQENKETE